MSDRKAPEPMDPGAREVSAAEQPTSRQRTCYAAVTLVGEVLRLFPETTYEVGSYNGRNVGLDVEFVTKDQDGLRDLLLLLGDPAHNKDPRISMVHDMRTSVIVDFRNQPRTYDLRDKFGLDEAWSVLGDEEAFDEDDDPGWEGGNAIYTSPDATNGGGA